MFQRSLLALPGPQDQRVLAPDAVEQGLAPRQIIYCRGSRVGNLSFFRWLDRSLAESVENDFQDVASRKIRPSGPL
jgi:hypothetical protein